MRRNKGTISALYQKRNVSNGRWAFSILVEAIRRKIQAEYGEGRLEEVVISTGDAEEAAMRMGMARGTGRAALSVLKKLGVVAWIARGRWSVKVALVRASWPGEVLEALAGSSGDRELQGARRAFLAAAMGGWGDSYEREYVRQVTQAAFRELWRGLRGLLRVGIVILEFVDVGGIWRDYQGMVTLARYLASSLVPASCITRV